MSTIKLRRDTAANWQAANPVLALAEPGYETDTGSIKYGDGVSQWSMLPYSNSNINATGGAGLVLTTDVGVLRVGNTDQAPTQIDPPHFHIRLDDHAAINGISDGRDFFFGDDDQFLRLASDGTTVLQARIGSEAPTVITGAPTDFGFSVLVESVSSGVLHVPVVTVTVPIDLQNYSKIRIDNVTGNSTWENYLNGSTFFVVQIDTNKFELYNNPEGTNYTSTLSFPTWISDFGGEVFVATQPGDVIIAGSGDTTGYGDGGSVYLETVDRGIISLETESGSLTLDQYGAVNLSGNGIVRNLLNGNINIMAGLSAAATIQWFDTLPTGSQPWQLANRSNYINVDENGTMMGSWDNDDDNVQLLLTKDGRLRLYKQNTDLQTTISDENSYIASRKSIELKSERVRVSGTLNMNSQYGWATEVGGPSDQVGWANNAWYTSSMIDGKYTYAVGVKYAYNAVTNHVGGHYYNTPIITKFDEYGEVVWNKKLVYTGSDGTIDLSWSDGFSTITTPNGPFFSTILNFTNTDGREQVLTVEFDSNGAIGQTTLLWTDEGYSFGISDTTTTHGGTQLVLAGEAWANTPTIGEIQINTAWSGVGYVNVDKTQFTAGHIPDYGYYEDQVLTEYYLTGNNLSPDPRINYVNCFGISIPSSTDITHTIELFVKKDIHTGAYSYIDWGGGDQGFNVGDTFTIPGAWVGNITTQLGVYAKDGNNYGTGGVTRLYFYKSNWPTLTTDLDLTTNPIISARDTVNNQYYRVTAVGESDPNAWYVDLDKRVTTPGTVWDFETTENNLTVTVYALTLDGGVDFDFGNLQLSGTGDTTTIQLTMSSEFDFSTAGNWSVYEVKGNDAVLSYGNGLARTYGGDNDDGFTCVTSDPVTNTIYAGGWSYVKIPTDPSMYVSPQYVGAVVAINDSGSILWQKAFLDDSGDASVTGIALSSDRNTVFVVGRNSDHDLLVGSYDNSGTKNWTVRLFKDDPIACYDPNLAIAPDGDLIISFQGGSVISSGADLYIIRLNSEYGQVRWMRQLGISETDEYTSGDFNFGSLSIDGDSFVIVGNTSDRFGGTRNSCLNGYVIKLPLDGTGTGTYYINGPESHYWYYTELVWPGFSWAESALPKWEYFEEYYGFDLDWTAQEREYGNTSDTYDLVTDNPERYTVPFGNTGTIENVYEIDFNNGGKIVSDEEGLVVSAPEGSEYAGLWYAPEADNGPFVAILAGSEGQEENNPADNVPTGNKATIYVEGNSWYFDNTGALRLPGDVTDAAGDSIILAPALTLNQNTGNVRVKTDMEFTGNYQGTITRFGSNSTNTAFATSVLDAQGENTYILGFSNDTDRAYVLGLDKQGNEVLRVQLEYLDGGNTPWEPNHIKFQRDNINGDSLMVAGEINWGSGIAVVQLRLSGEILNVWTYTYDQSGNGGLDIFDFTADSGGAPIVVGRETGDIQTYTQVAPVIVPTTFNLVSGGRGYNSGTNIPVTGGNGTGMTVDVTSDGLSITSVTINQQGTFYTVGDQLTVQLGTAGLAVAGYNFIGDFDIGVTYNTNDVVNYNGRTYVCVSFIGGQAPDSSGFWQDITVVMTLTSYWQQGSSIGQLVVNISDLDGNNRLAPWNTGAWQIDIDGTGSTWATPDRLCTYYDMPTENLSGSGSGFVINVAADTTSPTPNYAEISRSGLGNYLGNGYNDGDQLAVKGSLLGGIDTQRFINVVIDAVNDVGSTTIYQISKTIYPTLGTTVTTDWFVRIGTNKYPVANIDDAGGSVTYWFLTINTAGMGQSMINIDSGGNDCVVQYHSDGSVTLVPELTGLPVLPTQMRFSLVNSYINTDFSASSGWNIRLAQSGNGFIWSPNFQTSFGTSQNDLFHSITYNRNNNQIYVAGAFDDVNGYSQNIVMNLDAASGNVYWTKKVQDDSGNGQWPGSIVWANSNYGQVLYLVSVNYNGYTLVTKLNPNNGSLIWQRRSVDTQSDSGNNWYDWPTAAVDANGSVILGGEWGTNAAQNNVTLYSKLDQAGVYKWSNFVHYAHYSGNGDDINEFYNNDNQILSIGGNQFTSANYYYDIDYGYNQVGLSVRLPVDDVWDSAIYNNHGPFIISDYTYGIDYEDSTLTAVVEDYVATTPGTFTMSGYPGSLEFSPFATAATETNFVIGNANPAILFNDGSALKSAGFTRSVKDTTGDKTFTLTAEQNNTFLYFTETMGSQSTVLVPDEGNLETPFPVGYTVKIVKREGNSNTINVHGDSPGVVILGSGLPPGCNNWIFGFDGFSGVWTLMKIDLNTWIIEGPNLGANC